MGIPRGGGKTRHFKFVFSSIICYAPIQSTQITLILINRIKLFDNNWIILSYRSLSAHMVIHYYSVHVDCNLYLIKKKIMFK